MMTEYGAEQDQQTTPEDPILKERAEFETLKSLPQITGPQLLRRAELRLKLSGLTDVDFQELSQKGQSGEINDDTLEAMMWKYDSEMGEALQNSDQPKIATLTEFGRKIVNDQAAHEWNKRKF